jgi:hypothetical protein
MKRYLRVRVESGVAWPTKETTVSFRGHDLTLCPETDELGPSVLFPYKGLAEDEAIELVRHFLGSLSWAEGQPIEDLETVDGSRPIWLGKPRGRLVALQFRADYLPDPVDPKARLALSLYREALFVNSLPYRFLGFFKIVNVCYANGPSQKGWINGVVDKLDDAGVKKRVQALRQEGHDVGQYLYESGRCAVAHAWTEPIADPDSPADRRRLQQDLPVIRALAEWLIEDELGVKSRATIWREHLYELDGFRLLLGGSLVAALKEGREVALNDVPALPRLSLRVAGQATMPAFEGLDTEVAGIEDGELILRCRAGDGLVEILPALNFPQERLEFDPCNEHQFFVGDDGSVKAIQNIVDAVAMQQGLLLNGQFEVWNAETESLLGRTDPYVPVNIDLTASVNALESRTNELKRTEQERLAASAGPTSHGSPPGSEPPPAPIRR